MSEAVARFVGPGLCSIGRDRRTMRISTFSMYWKAIGLRGGNNLWTLEHVRASHRSRLLQHAIRTGELAPCDPVSTLKLCVIPDSTGGGCSQRPTDASPRAAWQPAHPVRYLHAVLY